MTTIQTEGDYASKLEEENNEAKNLNTEEEIPVDRDVAK